MNHRDNILKGYDNSTSSHSHTSYKRICSWITSWLSAKLDIDIKCINDENSILSYGLDSLSAVELEKDIITKFHLDFFVGDIFENVSIRDFIEIALKRQYEY